MMILVLALCVVGLGSCGAEEPPPLPQKEVSLTDNIQKWLEVNFNTHELATASTTETIDFTGPIGLIVTLGTLFDNKSDNRISFYTLKDKKPSENDLGSLDHNNLLRTLIKFADVKEEYGASDSNIIIALNAETTWSVIKNILISCARVKILKISFFVRTEKNELGLIPSYLPRDKGMEHTRILDDVNQITIGIRRIDKESDWEATKENLQRNLKKARKEEKKFPVKLRIAENAPFKQIIQVIALCRRLDFKEIHFSAGPFSEDTLDFQFESEPGGIEWEWLEPEFPLQQD